MAKIFKKLFVGDTVATSGSKCFKKLTTTAPTIIETVAYFDYMSLDTYFPDTNEFTRTENFTFKSNGNTYNSFTIRCLLTNVGTYSSLRYSILYDDTIVYQESDGWIDENYRTLSIGNNQTMTNRFYCWLEQFFTNGDTHQTLALVNAPSISEVDGTVATTMFAMPIGYTFEQFVGSVYDATNGAFELINNSRQQVNYNGQALLNIGEFGSEYATWSMTADTWYFLGEEPLPIISFTIDGISYQAEGGMTWAEWCESEYNTAGYYIDGRTIAITTDEGVKYILCFIDTNIIVDGTAYITELY